MNISVLGCGRWGSFHAWYANSIGHKVTLWGRTGSTNLNRLVQTGRNDYLTLSSDILLTDNLQQAVQTADICIVSINAQQFRSLAKRLKKETDLSEKPLVLCMKGLALNSILLRQRSSRYGNRGGGKKCNGYCCRYVRRPQLYKS